MASRAILVEDEPAAAQATRKALQAAGFEVVHYNDAVSALEHADASVDLIDLLVLDRRLPRRHGEAPQDEVGDELLLAMLQKHPDLVAVVFSGHTGFEHLQFATADRGSVQMRDAQHTFDRVRLFEKSQTIEFDAYIARVSSALSELDDIQIQCDSPESLSRHDRRLLRRVAFELGGASVEANALAGGLTDSPVWMCKIHSEQTPTACVVAKRQVKSKEAGGFQSLCPAQLTAGTISVVRGFCGGYFVTIQQLVGAEPVPLLGLLASDPTQAAAAVATLTAGLDAMHSGQEANIPISEISTPFEDWSTVQSRAGDFDIQVPPGSRIASTVRSAQHGDLHPANVLAATGQPVIIDFDSQTVGSELVDAIALLLGPLFHRDSPLRDHSWPSAEQCNDILSPDFLTNCPASEYFQTVLTWLQTRKRSDRELHCLLVAYCVRQLRYPDVIAHQSTRERAAAIARSAANQLTDS